MKILDRYIIFQFIPPFVVASFIALFVLVMQNLWLYLEDIMGKGVEFFIILEMLFYMSMSFIPLAIPVGILISSVLVFGNLGEKYELSSMKSAGISLRRIMAPLIILCSFIALFSYFTSNNIIPYSNLKFMTRLTDISRQKPALNLETKIFNYDFSGYAIRIGEKNKETGELKDVLIYIHDEARKGIINILTAKRGKMYTATNEKYLVMELYDGFQFQESRTKGGMKKYPVSRVSFDKLVKNFDLSEFDLARSDEERYATRERMLKASKLRSNIDSLEREKDKVFSYIKSPLLLADEKSEQVEENRSNKSTDERPKIDYTRQEDSLKANSDLSFLNTFSEKNRRRILEEAGTIAGYQNNMVSTKSVSISSLERNIRRHQYELYYKYCIAFVCVIFLFIGAPMGAIVRKGGYGYPMLVAILFFMVFMLLSDMFKSKVREGEIDAILGTWMPALVLLPIGVFMMIKASQDSKFFDMEAISAYFSGLLSKKHKT